MTWDVVSGKLKEIQKREEWIDWLDLAFAAKVLNPNEDPMRLLQLFELTQVKNFIRRRDLGYNRLSTSAFIPLARNYATLRFISEDLFQEFFEEAREAFAKNIEEQKNKNTLNDPEYIFYLCILAAEKVSVDENGLHLTWKELENNEKEKPIPERRKY